MVKNYLPLRTTETLIVLICYTSLCAFEAETAPIHSYARTAQFLARYGYLTPDHLENFGTTWPEPLFEAIADYQSFMGIVATGYINPETARAMTMPRCGVKDKSQTGNRWKRYDVQGSKGSYKDLTYKIHNYPAKLEPAAVHAVIGRAFAAWSEHTDLTFSPRSGPRKVDIDISFLSGYHGDEWPFDGPNGGVIYNTLAHAAFPEYGGYVHFDNDENWSINSFRGIDLYWVAVHEFGHSLGLDHSNIKSSVMYPKYVKFNPDLKLDDDDIEGIQALYGPKTNRRADATDSGKYEGSGGDAESDEVEGSGGDAESDGVEGSGGDAGSDGVEGSGGDEEKDANYGISESSYDDSSDFYF